LILSDALVNSQHLKLIISEEGINLLPLSSPVYVAGQEIDKELHKLNLFEFVSVGTTNFVIGTVDGEWPSLTSADIPELKKREEPIPEEQAQEEVSSEAGQETSVATTDLPQDLPPQEASLEDTKKPKLLIWFSSAASVIIVTILAIFFFWNSNQDVILDNPDSLNSPEKIALKIRTIVSTLQLERFVNVQVDQSKVLVEGWIYNQDDKVALEEAIGNLKKDVDLKIFSQKQIVENVRETIDLLKLPLTVKDLAEGKIEISGYYGDASKWAKIKSDFQKDVSGLRLIKDEVISAPQLQLIAAKLIKEMGLNGKVEVTPQIDSVIFKGKIAANEMGALKEMASLLQDKIGANIPMKNQVAIESITIKPGESAKTAYFNSQIDSVIIGEEGFVITRDGQRLFKGGVLPGGFTIDDINRETITLRKGKQIITLRIGEEI
jgi:type III secretion system YscD/HrpQ family protein